MGKKRVVLSNEKEKKRRMAFRIMACTPYLYDKSKKKSTVLDYKWGKKNDRRFKLKKKS